MADGDLIEGLKALGRKEREREEERKFVKDMFTASAESAHGSPWAEQLLEKHGKRLDAETERQEFMRKCEEGEV